jgi:hypothetical protein
MALIIEVEKNPQFFKKNYEPCLNKWPNSKVYFDVQFMIFGVHLVI